MRIAVASTDGVSVNEHFGKAERFLIYELGEGSLEMIEERQVEPLSVGDPKHVFDKLKFSQVADQLTDCLKVFVAKIGDKPAEELVKIGIEPVVFDGTISGIENERHNRQHPA